MTDRVLFSRRLLIACAIGLLSVATACSDDVDSGLNDNDGDADVGPQADAGDIGVDDTDIDDVGPGDPDADAGPDDPDADAGPDDPDADAGPDDPDADAGEPELPELTVDAIRPDRGPLQGGTPFTIEGKGFTDHSVVLFGSTEVETDHVDEDDDLIGVTPPSYTAGPVTVRVIDDETGDDEITDGFTYVHALEIDSVAPTMLPLEGGVEVTLEGQGFDEDTRISVGDNPAAEHEFVNSNLLRFTAPPHAEGPADLRATNEDDTVVEPEALTYVAPVEIDSVDPPYGFIDGGDEVVVSGQQFDDSLDVIFGNHSAVVDDVASDGTEATVFTPAGTSSGTVDVRVETDLDGARLDDGFSYLDGDTDGLELDAVVPGHGSTEGDERVHLTGAFADVDDPDVYFGDQAADVIDVDDQVLAVDTPTGADASTVDVTVEEGAEASTLTDAYTFLAPFSVADVSPPQGDVDGGTSVTVTGNGFEAVETLSLAGLDTDFDLISDQSIQFSTPAASAGFADLYVATDDGRSTLVEDAFEYIGPLELWNFDPTRGSIAGNTYVEISGTGFRDTTDVFFGGVEATEVERLDAHTLAVRTPPNDSDPVEVTAEEDGVEAVAPELFTYFNPGAQTGGAWGNPIDGSVNVTVFNIEGQPVHNAFVMLSTDADTEYSGATDEMGLVTLSGPDVFGEQTVTATAAEHSSATVQHVDAENITIFLHPDGDGDPPMPPPPPSATFSGQVNGLDKIEVQENLEPHETLRAVVLATRTAIDDDQIIDPGTDHIVDTSIHEDAEYAIDTRIGELALVAFAGVYDNLTDELEPVYMGTARYLTAADGGEYEVDIDLDIPLNSSIGLQFDGPPTDHDDPDGPDTNHGLVYIDLGIDGVYGPVPREYSTTSTLLEIDTLPQLSGDLHDAVFHIMAQTTREPVDDTDQPPVSQALVSGIDNLGQNYSTPPMVPTLEFITPAEGTSPNNGLVQWDLQGPSPPDFYYFQLIVGMGEVAWEVFLPGDVNYLTFPDFPDLSDYAVENEDGVEIPPMPYPGQPGILVGMGYRSDDVSIEDFAYDDLDPGTADASSMTLFELTL